ncbi:hypothetical protein D3C86_1825230 [compost metagenome]
MDKHVVLVKQIDRKAPNRVCELVARFVIYTPRPSVQLNWLCDLIPIARNRLEIVHYRFYNTLT